MVIIIHRNKKHGKEERGIGEKVFHRNRWTYNGKVAFLVPSLTSQSNPQDPIRRKGNTACPFNSVHGSLVKLQPIWLQSDFSNEFILKREKHFDQHLVNFSLSSVWLLLLQGLNFADLSPQLLSHCKKKKSLMKPYLSGYKLLAFLTLSWFYAFSLH